MLNLIRTASAFDKMPAGLIARSGILPSPRIHHLNPVGRDYADLTAPGSIGIGIAKRPQKRCEFLGSRGMNSEQDNPDLSSGLRR
jgi:hypothetical protein